ncbi:MAG: hypothetical protein LBP39_01255, partial [Rickettsiales bacterium]|nr:hypothetical protein [Rickettsiales bacterium]
MKFPRKRLDNCVRTVISMFFIFSTAIVFNASWASSDAVDVKNFAQLKKAVEDNKFKIEIVGGSDMKFSETIAIKRRNIGISGSGLGMVKFDGRNSSGFFDFDPGAEGIAIRNIEFANGKFEDERGIDARKASGGAFIIGAGASITLENTKFSGNVAIGSSGGAITSAKSSALIFRGRTNFDGNESKEGSGGAVYATGSSSLAFGEEVIFRNNKSSKAGGAVYSDRNSILLFKEEADFYDNKSGEVGGAIFANDSSSLTFEKETVFNDNKSCMGGAIYSQGNNILVFREKVTFRANDSSGKGGAIFAGTSGDINFSYGLGLVENTTGSKDGASGAIHMAGKGDSYIIKINIAQKDPFMSTVFRGNMSGDRCVAVYMEKYSALNFFLEEGDVNIFDAIEGDRTENSNTVTIEGSGGQFNLREEG